MKRLSSFSFILLAPALALLLAGNAHAQATVLPQFAFGGGWYSALYFTNSNGSPVAFTVNFVSDAGTSLSVPAVNGSSVNINLVAHGSAVIEAPNAGNLVQGYASFTPAMAYFATVSRGNPIRKRWCRCPTPKRRRAC